VRAIPGPLTNVHSLETIALFGGFVLGAALCLATYGLDLSAGPYNLDLSAGFF
jgi:hypothetical protein